MRVEMLDMAGDVGVNWTRNLLKSCLAETKIPVETVRVENSRKNKNLQDCLLNFNNSIHISSTTCFTCILCTLPCILVMFPK